MENSSENRIILNDSSRKFLFDEIKKKTTLYELAKKTEISQSMLYHYKNGRVNTIPENVFLDLINAAEISISEIKNIEKVSSKEIINKGLEIGRNFRRSQLKGWKKNLPEIKDLIVNDELLLGKWFHNYKFLIDFGPRKILKIEESENKIKITYTCYSKGKCKKFKTVLPRKIKLDNNFQYFFGLWCGDNVGGGRIGIVNKCEELYLFAFDYLKRIYQKPRFVILKSSKIDKIPDFSFPYTIYEIKNMPGDWVVCVFSVNGILKKFFDYLRNNLDYMLEILPNKNIFFAGLFDAEGNVFLGDNCVRWACKHQGRVKIYKKYLGEMDLFHRYDGGNLVSYNIGSFSKYILPYIKHPKKMNKMLLLQGQGVLEERFANILRLINNTPGLTQAEIAGLLNLKKVYSQIKFLNNYGYVEKKGYPEKVYLSKKGVEEIRREGQ